MRLILTLLVLGGLIKWWSITFKRSKLTTVIMVILLPVYWWVAFQIAPYQDINRFSFTEFEQRLVDQDYSYLGAKRTVYYVLFFIFWTIVAILEFITFKFGLWITQRFGKSNEVA